MNSQYVKETKYSNPNTVDDVTKGAAGSATEGQKVNTILASAEKLLPNLQHKTSKATLVCSFSSCCDSDELKKNEVKRFIKDGLPGSSFQGQL